MSWKLNIRSAYPFRIGMCTTWNSKVRADNLKADIPDNQYYSVYNDNQYHSVYDDNQYHSIYYNDDTFYNDYQHHSVYHNNDCNYDHDFYNAYYYNNNSSFQVPRNRKLSNRHLQ